MKKLSAVVMMLAMTLGAMAQTEYTNGIFLTTEDIDGNAQLHYLNTQNKEWAYKVNPTSDFLYKSVNMVNDGESVYGLSSWYAFLSFDAKTLKVARSLEEMSDFSTAYSVIKLDENTQLIATDKGLKKLGTEGKEESVVKEGVYLNMVEIDGRIFAETNSTEIHVFDKSNFSDMKTVSDVRYMALDKDGKLWATTADGTAVVEINSKTLEKGEPHKFGNNYRMHRYHESSEWFGTPIKASITEKALYMLMWDEGEQVNKGIVKLNLTDFSISTVTQDNISKNCFAVRPSDGHVFYAYVKNGAGTVTEVDTKNEMKIPYPLTVKDAVWAKHIVFTSDKLTTGISTAPTTEIQGNATVRIEGHTLVVDNAKGQNIDVYTSTGVSVARASAANHFTVALPAGHGAYIVKVGAQTFKMMK